MDTERIRRLRRREVHLLLQEAGRVRRLEETEKGRVLVVLEVRCAEEQDRVEPVLRTGVLELREW